MANRAKEGEQRASSARSESGRRIVFASGLLAIFAACSQAPSHPPAPVPAAIVEQLPTTIDEARTIRMTDPSRYERALTSLTKSADPPTAARAEALLGLFYFDEKRWSDASAALRKAAVNNAATAPWLRLRLAEADERRGDLVGAIAMTTEIVALAPDSSAATVARLRLPALLAKSGDAPATDAAFRQAMASPIDEFSEEEFVALAASLDSAARRDLGTAVRLRLLNDYPQGRFTETTWRELAATPALDALPFDDALALAQRLARNDRYDQAFDLMARMAARFPEDAAKSDAFRAARFRALFNSRHYGELLTETAGAKITDPAIALLRARAAWRNERPADFLAGLAQIERDFPTSKEATEAKTLRAKYYVTDSVDYARSVDNLKAVLAAGVSGNEGENLWNLGWTYTLWGRYDDALRTFDQYVSALPDADFTSNSLFWSGKILDKLGRKQERDARWTQLVAKYPFSYFSYRARELSGGSIATAAAPEAPQFPDLDAQLASVADPRLPSVRELIALGLTRDASREMKRVATAYPDNLGLQFMLADVYVQGGEPFKANGILQRRFRQFVRHGGVGVPRRFWEILFPLNYWASIKSEAERRGLDPFLVASIIRQESGFEPHVVSNAGAVGLMQIMPAEAERIASRAGLAGVTRETLFDAPTNIAVGAAEIRQKLEAMQGNDILAIAAYNAGETAVGRWLAQTPLDDVDLFVESIPYAETRLYVKSVTRNRFEYRRVYESSMASSQFQ